MNEQTMNRLVEVAKTERKSLTQIALKVSEECGELAEAVLCRTDAAGTYHKPRSANDVLYESVDVVISAVSVALKAGHTIEEITRAMNLKIETWQARQELEHKDRERAGRS